MYAQDGTLLAVPFDTDQRTITGGPVPLVEEVAEAPNGTAQFAHSDTGSLAYIPGFGGVSTDRTLGLVGRNGVVEPSMCRPPSI